MINRGYFINKGALCTWIQEAFDVQVYDPVTAPASLSRSAHCIQCRLPRSIAVGVCMKQRFQLRLQSCLHNLLCDSISHCGDAQLAHSSVWLGDFHAPYRLRLVAPAQQLFPNRWPVLLQVVGDSADGHSIDARATFISLHLPQGLLQVFSLTYFLHPSIHAGWAFGVMHHRERFGLFPFRFAGFTRWRRREVQFSLDVLPLVVLEIHVLLASPSRSGLRPPFPAEPIGCSTFRIGVPH